MSTLMVWTVLLAATACFLVVDLNMAWCAYRIKQHRSDRGRSFLRWWLSKSVVKLSVMVGMSVVVALALLLQDYTLVLPDIWGRVFLSRKVQWVLTAALVMAAFMLIDLFRTWCSCRTNTRGSRPKGVRFYWWWLRKSALKFTIAGGVAGLALGSGYVAQRYNLLHLKSETSGYMANAQRYYGQKKYREAALELRNAIKQNGSDHEAHLMLARSYWRLGNLLQARDAYREAIRIEPKLYAARLELGRLAFVMGEFGLALMEAEQSLSLAPRAPEPRLLLATIYLATKKDDLAVEQYRAVLGVDPVNREVRKLLVGLLLSLREFADAGRVAEAGLKQNPRDTELQVSLARAQEGVGQRAAAVATLQAAAERDTSSPLPLIALGALRFRAGEYVPAMQSYEEALKRDPDNVSIMNNLALLIADHGFDLPRAAELASRLYAKYPGKPAVVDTMGWVLCRQGKLYQALPLLNLAATGTPNNPAYRYHYGAALLKAGQTVAGHKELEAALKLSTEFDGAVTAQRLLKTKG